jgi:cytochrome P450
MTTAGQDEIETQATSPGEALDDCLLPLIDFAHEDVPDMHALLGSLRDIAPIVPIRYWGQRRMLILSHDLLKQAWLDDEHFRSADAYMQISEPSMGRTLQTMFGDEHRRNRFLVSGLFTPKAVRGLRENLIEPAIHELLDNLEDKPEADLVRALTQPFPFRVITRLLDLPVDDEPRFLSWAAKLLDYPWDPEGAVAARDAFTAYLADILDARRKRPGTDMLSTLS